MSWPVVKLGKIVSLRKGRKPNHLGALSEDDGLTPLLLIDEVRGFPPKNGTNDRATVQVIPADICIVWDGANAGTVGFGLDGAIGSTVSRIRFTATADVFTPYVGRLLQAMFAGINARASGKGATIPHVDKKHLLDIEIPMPPLPEQKRIAAILDQADALRRLRARALEKVKVLGQTIFQEMFGRDLAQIQTIPLGQRTLKIGSGATPKGGDAAYKDQGIPLIRSMNVRDGSFSARGLAFIDETQAKKLDNVVVENGDVLLNITGASVARVATAPKAMAGARVNQHVAIIRCNESMLPPFLESFLLLPATKSKLINIAEAGATRQAITKAQIEVFEVPVVSMDRQREFVLRRETASVIERKIIAHSSNCDALFASLQHRAFRGEL